MNHKTGNFWRNLKTRLQDEIIADLLESENLKSNEIKTIKKLCKNRFMSKIEASIIIDYLMAVIQFRKTFPDMDVGDTLLTNVERDVIKTNYGKTLADYLDHPLIGQTRYEYPAFSSGLFYYPSISSYIERRYH